MNSIKGLECSMPSLVVNFTSVELKEVIVTFLGQQALSLAV